MAIIITPTETNKPEITRNQRKKMRNLQREQEIKRKKNIKNLIVIILVVVLVATAITLGVTLGGKDKVSITDNDNTSLDNSNNSTNIETEGKYGTIISGNPTIMDIGSTSCKPCQMLQPVLTSLGVKYDGEINIKFYDCWNTTSGANMATNYNVTSIPTLIFLNGAGKEVSRLEGYNSQSAIESEMRSLGWI